MSIKSLQYATDYMYIVQCHKNPRD